MIIGARLPHTGPQASGRAVVQAAIDLEAAGLESLWVSDHIAQPHVIESAYPFEADGVARWSTQHPDLEALVTLAMVASVTRDVRLGTAILLAPLRQPVLAAKQIATIASAAPGRVAIGIGAGWLAEEFAALGIPYERRGRRTEEWMTLVRQCWTGSAGPFDGEFYTLPGPIVALPAPDPMVPLYTGGHSPAALRRAGRSADGWVGQQSLDQLDPSALAGAIAVIRGAAAAADRDPAAIHVVLRLVGSAGAQRRTVAALPALAAAGVDEVILDTPREPASSGQEIAAYREAVA
ncbi:TIGR03619 family F420-dependent LLM class oxidoreductase [Demequina capsici]|uniref:TIGR03619 family F420-dependent LLM class oxidoreductase n=1 Tax=Demequina capsici TaxID=3075620 RepID=A0AA96FD48_9MICO|nr:TIGR03619 family F420-dependent LLM class oxidoreductase [Demequina sp. PMTSA13]WNM27332.1 TIGR03619 family F420-dependent LLM class oxidoreductase [Demequina sp. PMTSA13]